MLAMHYAITLPGDYDMDIIRRRVADKGHLADQLPQLAFKAFLVSQKGELGNRENSYAPFYLWHSPAGAIDIIMGDMFKGIVDSFGWQKINNWLVCCYSQNKRQLQSKYALKQIIHLKEGLDLKELRRQEEELHQQSITADNISHCLTGINPESWTLVRFSLATEITRREAENQEIKKYELLHLSHPI